MEWFILRYPIVCFNIPQVLFVRQYASFLYYSYSLLYYSTYINTTYSLTFLFNVY